MLPEYIIEKILAKYGKERIFPADCAPLGREIGLSESTMKRMLGLVGADSPERRRTPHNSTMEILAKWLGYGSYEALMEEADEGKLASEFTRMESIEVAGLAEGAQIRLRYHPGRVIDMTYLGKNEFRVDCSKNSKLACGDRLRITHLILNQELIVADVVRGGHSLGAYRGARDGGLTSLEVIG